MGWQDFLSDKKDAGRDAGNGFALSGADDQLAKGQLGNLLRYQGSDAALDPLQSSRTATSEVQNNAILGQLYGNDGTLSRTNKEEQDLASRGFSLKPEDYEAYGQASDQIARNFGGQEQGLAQALSARGLSNSGSAATSFTGLQGNKMEQLGQMQRKIANDRMTSNLNRLGQTRSFLSNLAGQAGHEIQNQFGRQQSAEGMRFGQMQSKNDAAMQRLGAQQNQANENLGQQLATQTQKGWAKGLQGEANNGEQIGMTWATMGMNKGKGGSGSDEKKNQQKKQQNAKDNVTDDDQDAKDNVTDDE